MLEHIKMCLSLGCDPMVVPAQTAPTPTQCFESCPGVCCLVERPSQTFTKVAYYKTVQVGLASLSVIKPVCRYGVVGRLTLSVAMPACRAPLDLLCNIPLKVCLRRCDECAVARGSGLKSDLRDVLIMPLFTIM